MTLKRQPADLPKRQGRHLLEASLVVTTTGFIAGWVISPTAFLIFASLYTATAVSAWLVGREHPWMRAFAREVAPARVILILLMFAMPHIASDAAPWMLSLFGPSALTAAALCGLNDGALTGAVGEVRK